MYLSAFFQQMLIHFHYKTLAYGIFKVHQNYVDVEIHLPEIMNSSL